MRRILSAFLLLTSALAAQTSNYPASLDTNTSLFATGDNLQTYLTVSMLAGDAVAIVKDTTGFTPNMIATICEATITVTAGVTKCSSWEHMLVTAVTNSNTLTVTRGFAGTSAIAHASGKVVSVLIDSAHQAALKSAVLALETAVGTLATGPQGNGVKVQRSTGSTTPNNCAKFDANGNTVDAGKSCVSATMATSTDYQNFASGSAFQSPADNLSPSLRTITLTPVPLGVNGADSNHPIGIYNSGGVWQENCVISGGTAVGGGASGTVLCASLSGTYAGGSYRVGTATAGIVEARTASANGVYIPAGTFNIYATITPPVSTTIVCAGSGPYRTPATTLQFNVANAKFFNVVNDNFDLEDCNLIQAAGVAAVSGNVGIYVAGSGSGVANAHADWATFRNLTLSAFYFGFSNDGDGGAVNLYNMFVASSVSTGLVGKGAQGWWQNVTTQVNGTKQTTPATKADQGHGIYLSTCAAGAGCGTPPWLSGIQTFSDYGYGIYVDSVGLFLSGAYSYLNNDRAGEICCVASGVISDFQVELAGVPAGSTGYPTNTTAIGIQINNGSSLLKITNGTIDFNQGIGIYINNTPLIVLSALTIASNGQGAVAGNLYGLKIATGASVSAENLALSDPVLVTGANNTKILGSYLGGGTAGLAAIQITGSSLGVFLDQNDFANGGGGNSLQCDAGSTLVPGSNHAQGTVVNNCAVYSGTNPNVPSTYTPAGLVVVNSHEVWGVCTLGTNCAVTLTGGAAFTSSASYTCVATDQTAAAAVKANNVSGSAVTFTGTGADVLGYYCKGN